MPTNSPKQIKEPAPKKKNEITIEETEEDIVLGARLDPDNFKEEIKKEAEKSDIFAKFVVPIFVFLLIAGAAAAATWYYAKPERSVEQTTTPQDKIQTPPVVKEENSTTTNPQPQTNTQTQTTVPTPTTATTTTTPSYTKYTVKEGDTMSGIANKYDLTSKQLADYNGITDVNSLHIGQVLKIPTK